MIKPRLHLNPALGRIGLHQAGVDTKLLCISVNLHLLERDANTQELPSWECAADDDYCRFMLASLVFTYSFKAYGVLDAKQHISTYCVTFNSDSTALDGEPVVEFSAVLFTSVFH